MLPDKWAFLKFCRDLVSQTSYMIHDSCDIQTMFAALIYIQMVLFPS
jgi:hypothetical protein